MDFKLGTAHRLSTQTVIDMDLSTAQLAKHYGLKEFDTAIPQEIFNILVSDTFRPFGHFVYDYTHSRWGELFPLTIEGEQRMREVFND